MLIRSTKKGIGLPSHTVVKKKNYKHFSGHANKSSLLNTEHDTKYIKATATNR
jgi:hypothetical protein